MYLSLLRFKMGFLSSGLFLTLQLNDLAEGARKYRRVGYRHLSAMHEANFYLYECWLSQRASSAREVIDGDHQLLDHGQGRYMPAKVIHRLAHDGQRAWMDGFTSVRYAHLSGEGTTLFPLWVISFWKKTLEIITNARTPWLKARDWVNRQLDRKTKPELRKSAIERFLGTEWLSSTDENDLLETLRERIGSDPDLVGDVRVEAVELTARITAAFEHQESGSYLDSRWISSLGADIFERGERVITYHNCPPRCS
ncbi:hypothetical protein B0H14DRAFT_3136546 [Mycena olivaceomarginata]|nr:hypothetical protein B0H14DRAFT_3136546 [Mycena olivaceomarginata]